jgi:hypothetical protein
LIHQIHHEHVSLRCLHLCPAKKDNSVIPVCQLSMSICRMSDFLWSRLMLLTLIRLLCDVQTYMLKYDSLHGHWKQSDIKLKFKFKLSFIFSSVCFLVQKFILPYFLSLFSDSDSTLVRNSEFHSTLVSDWVWNLFSLFSSVFFSFFLNISISPSVFPSLPQFFSLHFFSQFSV